ncbi:hypothetical protein KL86DYS2_11207 [uncultured Dysgonomonas sp.]|uniref:Uncharacterized protein n=1 Tax=uncultured Dysgonomonas sp. TaxID=206096 RepID=A0A212JC97_9BACT|nr:hypothetical protein KL86DYS2_11207 [uncultured Dysgonomonas sp.]
MQHCLRLKVVDADAVQDVVVATEKKTLADAAAKKKQLADAVQDVDVTKI